MTAREKLIELINKKQHYGEVIIESQMDDRYNWHSTIKNSELADYLLENGVCVLPYKIDTTIWTNEPFTDGAVRDGDTLIERQRADIERLKSEKLVRCGDCKFYGNGDCSVQSVRSMYPNDYCSYGERRSDINA